MNTNATDAAGLTHVVPASWQPWIPLVITGAAVAGRTYHALANGRGLKGVFTGLLFGTNTPAPVKPQANPAQPVQ